ncbi:S66 family peptidase [Streptomyces fuscichromogenes]|uniref:LD-carboxypeptidase n=1 Tax=Streptomyces fuscichromogenes TaxID=1324013 RepID=A0A917X9E2_9ACTN|nr:S66 peptidase family protein [Streptomyces fuscichromogenes]GGM93684.1 LD-carboxypeptidase [Streptomyces fuscichromogenes]
MSIRYPRPLRPGDRVGVTSPSSGVPEVLRGRLDAAVRTVEERGYEVVTGRCMDGATHLSAPAAERAAELTAMLTDPTVRAVVPPWGGETGIDLLPLLDFEALGRAEPTWVVGYSDLSTLITPLTLRTGVATVHGNCLMETPYLPPDGLLSWLDVVAAPQGKPFAQTPPGRYRVAGRDDWIGEPGIRDLTLDGEGGWTRLDGHGDVDVEGRLIGGCTETLANLAGTPYLDTAGFAGDEPLLVYVEACEDNAFTICRNLHGMRLAGFFDRAAAVLVGRTRAPDSPSLSQHEAVLDALGPLGVPVVADVECGHVPPFLPLVNGARGRVLHTAGRSQIVQTLD